jgi:hypothetical protein
LTVGCSQLKCIHAASRLELTMTVQQRSIIPRTPSIREKSGRIEVLAHTRIRFAQMRAP